MTGTTWDWMETPPCAAAANMALDEALLTGAARRGRAVLRFYSWTEPAATFGYFQRHEEVAAMTPLRPLVRRTTGGGLVPHDADWTYSLVFPPSHPWYDLRAEQSYLQLHEWLRDAFHQVGVDAVLAPCCAKELPGQCFAGPEKFDLVHRGRKISGAAQRRSREGLLVQGSVQGFRDDPLRSRWQQALLDVAERSWRVQWRPVDPGSAEEGVFREEAGRLEREKYGQDAYNRRR